METNVYRVTLEIYGTYETPYGEWETIYKDYFPTKTSAIRVCQSKFAKRNTNKYVQSVHAEVRRITITDKGVARATRIYNLYKTTN